MRIRPRVPLKGPRAAARTRSPKRRPGDGRRRGGHPLRRSSASCAATASKSARTRARGTPHRCRPACHTARAGGGTAHFSGRRGGIGKNGSTRSHNGSGSSVTAMPVQATSPTRIKFRRFCYTLLEKRERFILSPRTPRRVASTRQRTFRRRPRRRSRPLSRPLSRHSQVRPPESDPWPRLAAVPVSASAAG